MLLIEAMRNSAEVDSLAKQERKDEHLQDSLRFRGCRSSSLDDLPGADTWREDAWRLARVANAQDWPPSNFSRCRRSGLWTLHLPGRTGGTPGIPLKVATPCSPI